MKVIFLLFLNFYMLSAFAAEPSLKQLTIDSYLQQAKADALAQGFKANSLIHETSPYLLQHAYNPVQWYPWGEEAFAKAKKENKAIFLSIGYTTCHWCHVMARESFENVEIAKLLNSHFISIKVDREQRPDIDAVYLSATKLISGHGGWPMTVFLDNDLRPFHAATYYPPFTINNRTGLKDVLLKVQQLWTQQPALINDIATKVSAAIKAQSNDTSAAEAMAKNINALALKQITASFDQDYGGFSVAPKFLRPSIFTFLNKLALTDLIETDLNKDKITQTDRLSEVIAARDMMRLTLDEMAYGGIYDQLSGGFHRYSVDEFWQVPHFEKMLYSQALMVIAYSEFYRVEARPKHKQVVLETLSFVIDEMQSPEGGFYSALSAVSERSDKSDRVSDGVEAEGAYYLWHESELRQVLSLPEFEFIKKYFQIRETGNIDSDPNDEFINLNILFVDEDFKNVALTKQQMNWLVSAREKLNKVRRQRPRPLLDDKIITAWNGMMIAAFAKASVVFNEPLLLRPAIQALGFIKDNLYVSDDKKMSDKTGTNNKKLYRQYRKNITGSTATLSDYVWLVYASLEVYKVNREQQWLAWALALHEKQNQLFLDEASGAYYESVASDTSLLFRSKSIFDGALPSANAIALSNLYSLSKLSGDLHGYRESGHGQKYIARNTPSIKPEQETAHALQAAKLVRSFAAVVNQNPASASMLLAIEIQR